MTEKVLVTLADNVSFDVDGQLITDENGDVIFNDSRIIGYVVETKTEISTVLDNSTEPPTQSLAMIMRCLVCWEHQRSPAFQIEDPNHLVWLSFSDPDQEADETVEEDLETDYYDDNESGFIPRV